MMVQRVNLSFVKELKEPLELAVDDGYVLHPDCKTRINVGRVGIQNYYKRHKNSTQCAVNKKKKSIEDSVEKAKQNAQKFFCPKPPTVPPTVKAPAPICPNVSSGINLSATLAPSPGSEFLEDRPRTQAPKGCPIGIDLMRKL